MFYSVASYTVGSYEAYWKDVLVLQEVAEAVAAQVNEDTGTQSVDANALAEVLKDVVLAPAPGDANAHGAADAAPSEDGALEVLRTLNTDAVGTAARQLTDTLLRPVDAEQMASSASEAEANGVSGLSVAMAVAVVESLGASANSMAAVASAAADGQATPDALHIGFVADQPAPSTEAPQDQAITRMAGATSVAWMALSDAASSSNLEATVQSAQHVDTMSKALGLLASGVVQAQVNEQSSTATLAAAVVPHATDAGAAHASIVSTLAATDAAPAAPLIFPSAWQSPVEQDSVSKDTTSSPPPPSGPLKRFIWVVKQVLAWRWKERTVTVVQESASANQALDDKKLQDKEHSQDDRRYLKHLEQQNLAQKAAWQHRERDPA
jgi:hypothetical protein